MTPNQQCQSTEGQCTLMNSTNNYFAFSGEAEYCDERVCMSVSLSVCEHISETSSLHQILCTFWTAGVARDDVTAAMTSLRA